MGVPGCGKTSVMELALKRIKEKYIVINFGTLMFEIFKEKNKVKTRDEMRKLSDKMQLDIQKRAAQKIAEMSKNKNIIVDTHCSVQIPKGYLIGLPETILKKIAPSQIILIESSAKEIYERRIKDNSRARDEDSVEKIDFQQEVNRILALSFCSLTGAVFTIVKNKTGELLNSSRELAEVIEI